MNDNTISYKKVGVTTCRAAVGNGQNRCRYKLNKWGDTIISVSS